MTGLNGKVALVTGASRSVGKGIALELAAQGVIVYITARRLDENGSGPRPLRATELEIANAGTLPLQLPATRLTMARSACS